MLTREPRRLKLAASHASCIRFLVHTADGERLSMSAQIVAFSTRVLVLPWEQLAPACSLLAAGACRVFGVHQSWNHAARAMHIHESSVYGPAAAGRKTLKRSTQLQWCIWCARCQTAQMTSDAPGADGVLFTSAQGDV